VLNRDRNRCIVTIIREVVDAAAAIGSKCVLVKGGALLLAAEENLFGVWTMRDVDVLIPMKDIHAVTKLLQQRGTWPRPPSKHGYTMGPL
jgi:hypothetical protein